MSVNEDELRDASGDFENAVARADEQTYVLRLFVAGMTPHSRLAVANVRKICENNLQGRYELEVVDMYQQPDQAISEQIFAVPTLVKKLPLPLRKIIGDMSDTERVLVGLNLQTRQL